MRRRRIDFNLKIVYSTPFLIFRHGMGCERTVNPDNNLLLNEFIGSFRNGRKNGEGQRFYDNGIYDGAWKGGKRSGRGIMWFDSGELYLGEWLNDVYDGPGVLVRGDNVLFVNN